MLTENDARNAISQTLYDQEGAKIGKIGQVYLNNASGDPEFFAVNTGFFGSNESFVPSADARLDENGVTVPYSKDKVKDAPNVDADGQLSIEEEQAILDYYGMGSGYDSTSQASLTDTGTTADLTASQGVEGHDTSGPTTDEAMTRSEEQLHVETRSQQAGAARLRKYVTTEQQTVTVPVSKEYAVLETEPITDENRGSAMAGGDITSEEHEVLLNEEVVEVSKTVNPVERVKLGVETRTEDETVSEEVRQENIEVEGDVEDRRR